MVNVPIFARKVLVHALPPLLTREEFISQLPASWILQPSHTTIVQKNDPERENKIKILLYVQGNISKQRNIVDFSRVYVILETAVAVKKFCEELHGRVFETSSQSPPKLKSTKVVVELAPVSRLPSKAIPDFIQRRRKKKKPTKNEKQ